MEIVFFKFFAQLVLVILALPVISRASIQNIHKKSLQWTFFITGYISLRLTPFMYKKIQTREGTTHEGFTTKSTLVKCLYLTGQYEPSLVLYLKGILKPGDVFIDVGANEGFFSITPAMLGAKVYAIEPAKKNVEMLEKNTISNKLADEITIIQKAAGNRRGMIEFNENLFTGLWNTVETPIMPSFFYRPYVVEMSRVEKMIPREDFHKIKAIKIDTEGSELQVVLGMLSFLDMPQSIHWIIELHADSAKGQKILKLFKDRGCEIYRLPLDTIAFPQNLESAKEVNNIHEEKAFSNYVFVQNPRGKNECPT